MKYSIIGTGAIGGYYGALLARRGYDVHFLLRSDFEHVRQTGLIVESVTGNFRLPQVNAYSTPEDLPLCDVALVALKTTQNHQLSSILPHVVKKNGTIVVLQNGLGVEADIAAIMPNSVIIGGMCFICSNKIGPGKIAHLDYGGIRMAEYRPGNVPAGITSPMKSIAETLRSAGIDITLEKNLGEARWKKLVWNIPYNGLSVILNATTDRIMANEHALDLVRDVMREVITAAHHCGFTIDQHFADTMLNNTFSMAAYSPSMKLDIEDGRKLEIEAIYWRPILAAHAVGYDMPLARLIARQLEFIDQNSRQGHAPLK